MKTLKLSNDLLNNLDIILQQLTKVCTPAELELTPLLMGGPQCACAGSCKGGCKGSLM